MNPLSLAFSKSSILVARTVAQVAVVGAVGALSVSVMSSSAFTSLQAVATNTTNPVVVDSGTLSLTPTDIGDGFAFSNGSPIRIQYMAPADTVNRVFKLKNSTLAGKGLTLKMVENSNSPTNLTTDATRGLHLWVQSCTAAWTLAGNNDAAVCSGSTADVLGSFGSPVSLYSLGTATALNPSTLAANAYLYLKFSITLPNQVELITNGSATATNLDGTNLASGATTIQGLTASITWTITEYQNSAVTTNS